MAKALHLTNLDDETFKKYLDVYLEAVLEKLNCDGDVEKKVFQKMKFIEQLKRRPIAINTAEANDQHYEVPTDFYLKVLGPWLKYSCCYWSHPSTTLEEAEEEMMRICCERAGIEDGQNVLDLGCGWGSLTMWILLNYPNCRVSSLSNSATQTEFIRQEGSRRGVSPRLTVILADANVFTSAVQYDRVLSIEMFEHMSNYEALMQKVFNLLKPNGKLFTHILCHREYAYPMILKRSTTATDFIAQYFFTGGNMPSSDLFLYFQKHLQIEKMWSVNGVHYAKTLDAWLALQDRHSQEIMEVFKKSYGGLADEKFHNWRKFFMYCSRVFGFRDGNEWVVTQHLFSKKHTSQL